MTQKAHLFSSHPQKEPFMNKQLFLIHGRDFKPDEESLKGLWFGALKHGLKRDYSEDMVAQFNAAIPQFIYYGELSNKFLYKKEKKYEPDKDLKDRQRAIEKLMVYSKTDLHGNASKFFYNQLPGKNPVKEWLADMFATPLDWIGFSEHIISVVAPDMKEYWNFDRAFGSDLRCKLTGKLVDALSNGKDIMVIGHSLGSIIAYDVLWKFSHYCEYQDIKSRKISTFLTLGCPLGNETVKKNLKGANADGERRYPKNINHWINVAAEDDFISHDETLAENYREMTNHGLIEPIQDHRIYNLSLRKGKSNPHHGVGYLIHPIVIRSIAEWLTA